MYIMSSLLTANQMFERMLAIYVNTRTYSVNNLSQMGASEFSFFWSVCV